MPKFLFIAALLTFMYTLLPAKAQAFEVDATLSLTERPVDIAPTQTSLFILWPMLARADGYEFIGSRETHTLLQALLQQAAQPYTIGILFPLFDLKDLREIDPDSFALASQLHILDTSRRYATDGVIISRIHDGQEHTCEVHWRFVTNEQDITWNTFGTAMTDCLSDGFRFIKEFWYEQENSPTAAIMPPQPATPKSKQRVYVMIHDIKNYGDMRLAVDLLTQQNQLSGLRMKTILPDRILFEAITELDPDSLSKKIEALPALTIHDMDPDDSNVLDITNETIFLSFRLIR